MLYHIAPQLHTTLPAPETKKGCINKRKEIKKIDGHSNESKLSDFFEWICHG